MKKTLLPLLFILPLAGCGDSSQEYDITQDPLYDACYNAKGAIVRGAPEVLEIGKKPTKQAGEVVVFPAPRVPRAPVGNVSLRDIYSNLANKDPQVRSDTLYTIEQILGDKRQSEATQPQIKSIFSDYMDKLSKSKECNRDEYNAAKKVYDDLAKDEGKQPAYTRPNWEGIPSDTMAGHGLEEPAPVIEKVPAPGKVDKGDLAKVETQKPVTYDDVEYPEIEPLANIDTKGVKPDQVEQGKVPAFDFTKPKSEHEPTEIETQMAQNREMAAQKKLEDDAIDKGLNSIGDANLLDWSCNKEICRERLATKWQSPEDLLSHSKSILDLTTESINSRLWAICSMKCVAQADKKLEPDVVEYLSKYIRRRSPWIIPAKGEKEKPIMAVRPDIQAALYVTLARDRMRDVGFEIGLMGTDLRGANLSFANLYNTNLSFSNLSATDMSRAYGLFDWNRIYLATIDETTLIPDSVFAGFIVVKKPKLPPMPVGSYKITTDDWIYWNAEPIVDPNQKYEAPKKSKAGKMTSNLPATPNSK